jgi:hypothetical protein
MAVAVPEDEYPNDHMLNIIVDLASDNEYVPAVL